MKVAVKHVSIFSALFVTGVYLNSCSKKDSKSDDAPQAQSLADLKLSSALGVTIPEGIKNAAGGKPAQGLRLKKSRAGKKSMEACQAVNDIDNMLRQIRSGAGTLCHMEVEGMGFGKKYNVKITGLDDMNLSVYVDNTDPANLKVYTCNDGTLAEQFVITGFNGVGKIKGTLSQYFEGSFDSSTRVGDTFTAGINAEFDFTETGVQVIKSSMKYTSAGSMSSDFRSYGDIRLVDSGVSKLLISREGTFGPMNMSQQEAVYFNGTNGQALFSGVYQDGANGEVTATHRSSFNADGTVIANSEATADITVDKTALPAKLAASFSPTKPAGWDCTGDEDFTVDMTGPKAEAHAACDVEHPAYDCADAEFEFGETEND